MDWLLLRGLARERRHWYDFPSCFKERLGVKRVELLDVAGVGTECARAPRPSAQWLARDLARRVEALEPPDSGAWSVLGVSLGGMLALELCRLMPKQVLHAIVINASSRISFPHQRMRPRAASALARIALLPPGTGREEAVLALTAHLSTAARRAHAERAASFARDAPMRSWAVTCQLVAALRFTPPRPRDVRARLLFLCSRRDALVAPSCSWALAARYSAECQEHPWAGHDLALDDPNWLMARVSQFATNGGIR